MEGVEAVTVDDIDIFRAAEVQHRCKRGAVSHLIDGSLDNWGEAPGGFKWHENEPAPVGSGPSMSSGSQRVTLPS